MYSVRVPNTKEFGCGIRYSTPAAGIQVEASCLGATGAAFDLLRPAGEAMSLNTINSQMHPSPG